MVGEELAEPRQQPVRGENWHGGDPKPLAATALPRDRPREIGKGTAGGRRKQAAGRREFDATWLTLEELFAQGPFQAGDSMADRRRGDVQGLARGLERAKARGEIEGLQREKIPRRQLAVAQKASAGIDITVAAPALIWWLSAVLCGRTRAM